MKNSIYLFLMTALLSSCAVKKRMAETKQTLNELKTNSGKETSQLRAISKTSYAKLSEGNIDSNIDTLVRNKLNSYAHSLDSIQMKMASIDTLLVNKKNFHKKNYQSYILPLLDSLRQLNATFAQREKLYQMVANAVDISTFHKFDLAAFFGSGKYIIPEDKISYALKSFSPIVDAMLEFSKQYEDIPKTGTLIILGYADGMGFANDSTSSLLDSLTAMLGKPDPTKSELNDALSQKRAESLRKQIQILFSNRASSYNNYRNLRLSYNAMGKGEAYPPMALVNTSYTVDDPRRRIVLCYWTVLPD